MDQPFNVVHEMYRLVYLKSLAQRKKDEEEKAKAEEKKKQEQEERREKLRTNVPAFATKSAVLGTPPQNEETSKPVESKPEDSPVVQQMISSDMEDMIEEVLT
jgi:hypothetical protein